MESIQALRNEYEANKAKVDGILALGDAITAEQVVEAEELNAKNQEICAKVRSLQRVEKVRSDAAGLEQWATALPGVTPGTGTYTNGVTVLGLQEDGAMTFDTT